MLKFSVFAVSCFMFFMLSSQQMCATHKILEQQLSDPQKKALFLSTRESLKNHLSQIKQQAPTRGTVYTIPVVFHVLHDGGLENITRDQILDALAILNRDYRRLNQDADNVAPEFQGLPADIEVEFKLATKAPNGNCFSGITRTQSPMSFDQDGWNQVQAIIDGNDVYNDEWPGDQYLNFFICGAIGFGAAGYTYLPGSIGPSMFNEICVLQDYVWSIVTRYEGRSRVLTHEVGHWFDLPHTWGYTNDPGLLSNCSTDDDIIDTPNTVGASWCDLTQDDCGPIANVENYMDYSYCSKMFTEGQKERMRATLTSSIDGRNNLVTAQNIALTGADDNFYLCEAKFSQNFTNICQGEIINFTDLSFNKATSWTWYFEGGTPAISTDQNPNVMYSNSGKFNVKLIVSDGVLIDSIEQTDLITVLNESMTLPFYEDFEAVTVLNETAGWIVQNPQNNQAFTLTDEASYSGNKSVYINNYQEGGNNIDELISYPIDLSSVDSLVTLSFRFSYKRKPTITNEKLQVFVSTDCGETWSLRRTLSGLLLTNEETEDNFIPVVDSEWKIEHVDNLGSVYWTDNFRFKFRFSGFGGNNIFIDDINIYEGPPSETVFSQNALMETEKEQANCFVFPNPAKDSFKIKFNNPSIETCDVLLVNELGQIVYSQIAKQIPLSNEFELKTTSLKSGIYTLKIIQNDKVLLKKLIIQ